ncbi:MAG TPA: chemotaxis response regulator protein-glutamate methylesterase [Terriglobia bacterium]|nr:chemotaxis response regulator protein-glutamate methylesterase [Terriglobia bacterium]
MNSVGKKVRVLVVDDSAFMRKVMNGLISADASMQVVGEAGDGREAVAMAESLRPDVISMDINMPHLDGLGATEIIMSQNPRPIVIVSSESQEGARGTLRALQLGAVDFVSKPASAINLDMNSVRDELTRKLKIASKVRVVRTATRPNSTGAMAILESARPAASPVAPAAPAAVEQPGAERCPLVIVAASTGGPAALMKMIPMIRKDFAAAMVLALHMPASFTGQFTEQLQEASAIEVKEAVNGEPLRPGILHVCPGSHHLRVSGSGRILLDDGPRISGYRPCADVTLESAANWAGALTIGVVLTGMGNDGARGVIEVKAAGGYVIAQDEATSMIFGMPLESVRTGVVNEILPLESIPAALEKRVLYLQGASRVGAL